MGILYQIKRAKERARVDKLREQMIAEGLDPDDEMQMSMINQPMGGGKANALAVLIAHGATVARAKAGDADANATKEQRRTLKNVEGYLSKILEVDATRIVRPTKKSKRVGITAREVTALEVAMLSGAPTPQATREKLQTNIAIQAREQLREVQRTKPLKVHVDLEKNAAESVEDLGRQRAEINKDDLAAIQAEMEAMGDEEDDTRV